MNLEKLERKWTPNREQRRMDETFKIRSARQGPLQGGDWVLNEEGFAATLSFTFLFKGQVYGLTVGHLAEPGESIFIFADDEELPHPLPDDDEDDPAEPEKSHFKYELGIVVSKSVRTDSLVFKISNKCVPVAPYQTLAEGSGVVGPLKLPDLNHPLALMPPAQGETLVGFGAQRRGSYGVVSIRSVTTPGTRPLVGDIGIIHPTDGSKRLTDPGDCGAIFVGLDSTPYYLHHCRSQTIYPFMSYGVPIWDVMGAHRELGGRVEEENETVASPVAKALDRTSLKKFNTTTIPPPSKDDTEDNSLAKFHGKLVCIKKPKKGSNSTRAEKKRKPDSFATPQKGKEAKAKLE